MPPTSPDLPQIAAGSPVGRGCLTAAAASSRNTIRRLNDEFRRDFSRGRIVITAGVAALNETERLSLLAAVRIFNDFIPGNDPYGEHDFGKIEVEGVTYCWKIDYYDAALKHGSADAADPALTTRVLTIMRSDEY
jgi:Protein of unknown function (DUF3768).